MTYRIYTDQEPASMNNNHRDQHNSSHLAKAEFNNCFITHSRYFLVLNKLTSS